MYFQKEFKAVIGILEDSILATDLAIYFNKREQTTNIIKNGVNWEVSFIISNQNKNTEIAMHLLIIDHFYKGKH